MSKKAIVDFIPAVGGWVLKAHTAAGSTNALNITTSAINTTGADLIILAVGCNTASSTVTVSDSMANTWTALTAHVNAGAETSRLWYCQSPTISESHTFTVVGNTGNVFPGLYVQAFSGSTPTPLDVQNGATSASGVTSFQTGSVTPTQPNDLIVTHILINGTVTGHSIDSGFTISDTLAQVGGQHYGGAMAYFIQGAAAAVNPTCSWTTTSTNEAASIAAFKI